MGRALEQARRAFDAQTARSAAATQAIPATSADADGCPGLHRRPQLLRLLLLLQMLLTRVLMTLRAARGIGPGSRVAYMCGNRFGRVRRAE